MAHYSLASIGLLASLRAAMCAVKSCVVSVVIALFPPAGIDIMCWLVHYQGTKCYGTLFPCKHRSSGQLASCYVCSQILCCERCDCLISTSRDWHHVLTGHYQGTKCYGTLFPCKHRSSGQLASCYVCSQILCCERCDCLISTSRDWHHVLTGPLSRHKMLWHTIPLQA